jgi:hypothetical protein
MGSDQASNNYPVHRPQDPELSRVGLWRSGAWVWGRGRVSCSRPFVAAATEEEVNGLFGIGAKVLTGSVCVWGLSAPLSPMVSVPGESGVAGL